MVLGTSERAMAAAFKDRVGAALRRPSSGVALALAIVGVLFILAELQSPSRLYWTGDAVTGTNSGGIIYYQVAGEDYTLDAPGDAPAHDTAVTVYVDPDDPGEALASRATKWVDAALVLVWFVAAVGCLALAALRRTTGRRRAAASSVGGATFGDGLGADIMQRHLDEIRRPPRPPSASS
jgi:hypothetical protein